MSKPKKVTATLEAKEVTTMADSVNATEIAPEGTIEIDIGDLKGVPLPRKWAEGMTHTAESALTTDTHNARQFSNNENANAKARATRYAKDGKPDDAPKDVAYYVKRWAEYESDIGRERMSTGEKLKLDAAWKAWHAIVKEHNSSVTAGNGPVLAKAGNTPIKINAKEKDSISKRLLEMPQYERYVQKEYDILLAEREADKGKSAPATAVAATADML